MATANSNPDLNHLVAALRSARDPWSRVKLVATGARTLARLQPRERSQLLHQLGLEGGEQLAALATGGDPQLQDALEQALQRLEADPQRLQRLGEAIAEPSSRRSTLSGLASYLLEAVTSPPAPPAPAAVRVAAAPAAPTTSPVPPAPVASPAPAAPPAPAPAAAPPAPAPAVAPAVPVASTPAPQVVVELFTPAALPPSPPDRPRASPPPADAVLAAAAATSALDDTLPSWAQRRSLAALFARGEPATVEQGLGLVERVPLAADRRWALADLAHSRPWSEREWASLVAAADSPTLRRRLALRRRAT